MRRLFFTHMFKHHGLPKDIVSRSQVHKYIFTNLVKAHGVEAQDECFIPTPNIWITQKGELGYLTILKELCGSRSTRLGGSFGVGQVLLQQFRTLGNMGHTFSNGGGQVTNHAYDLGHEWQPLSDANKEVPMVTQFDEERWRLWEMAKANF